MLRVATAQKCTSIKKMSPQLLGPLVLLWLLQFITGTTVSRVCIKIYIVEHLTFITAGLINLSTNCFIQFWATEIVIPSTSLPSSARRFTSTATPTFPMTRSSPTWCSGRREAAILQYSYGEFSVLSSEWFSLTSWDGTITPGSGVRHDCRV